MTGYVSRLRELVLHSADVLPEAVSEYISHVARHGPNDAREEILRSFRPLADQLPRQLADFAIEVITEAHTPARRQSYLDEDRLGLANLPGFFPASAIQGPFLYLLRADEDEGLRLVLTLADTAVANWRDRVQQPSGGGPGMTPLPIC